MFVELVVVVDAAAPFISCAPSAGLFVLVASASPLPLPPPSVPIGDPDDCVDDPFDVSALFAPFTSSGMPATCSSPGGDAEVPSVDEEEGVEEVGGDFVDGEDGGGVSKSCVSQR